MKQVDVLVSVCDCWCEYCKYNVDNVMFEVICPYKNCETESYHSIEWRYDIPKSQVVECEFCEKKIKVNLSYEII